MGLILVGPGRLMGLGQDRLALRQPVPVAPPESPQDGMPGQTLGEIAGLGGWWDGSSLSHLRDDGGLPVPAWNAPCREILDRTQRRGALRVHHFIENGRLATPVPHLSGLLGGVGQTSATSGPFAPTMDPDSGFRLDEGAFGSADDWTWHFVWSRPNPRQGSFRDGDPITLLRSGGSPILQATSGTSPGQLILFPSGGGVILNDNLARRHTHSIILRHVVGQGVDAWLDGSLIARNVPNPLPASPTGPTLLLHDGSFMGGAQCWFHEASMWTRALNPAEVDGLRNYATRWHRGARKGVTLLINGQSNAVNFALNDGAAMLLARGIAWHLGALAWNIHATTGNPSSHTMQSGHGLYQVQGGAYPGNFLNDPMNGAPASTWELGSDGTAVAASIQSLSTEDRDDIRAVVWPWNETDSLRTYGELATFSAAAERFIGLERGLIGKSADQLPLIWWSAIPYGTTGGTAMHRAAVHALSQAPALNVVVANPQTADSNQRGAIWDDATGAASGGDTAHRDADDNRRFARLAAPIVALAIQRSGGADALTTAPSALPRLGGPRISHVYREDDTTLIITVTHDGGSDLLIPRQAASGKGFAVTDGGTIAGQGSVIPAVGCERISPTQLRLTLAHAIQNPSSLCRLHYPHGGEAIGRGNAVTDNYASLPKPSGWDIGNDLGSEWRLDYPLAATMIPVEIADSPA